MGEVRRQSGYGRPVTKAATAQIAIVAALAFGGCRDRAVDPTPERLNGSSSTEFEQEDIDHANAASDAVKNYCSGAVSEAQYVGCVSHVDESDIR